MVSSEVSSSTTERVARVLSAFRDAPPGGYGPSELGRVTGLDKSVVHRILGVLTQTGLLERDEIHRTYRVGYALGEIGRQYRSGTARFIAAARFELAAVVADHGGTAYVAELAGTEIVYLATLAGPGPLRVHEDVGSRVPAHASALGKAILAYLPEHERAEALPLGELTALTPDTIVDRDALEANLRQVRQRGYATNHQEQVRGVGAIGVPILDPKSGLPRAAVSIAFPLLPDFDRFWIDMPDRLVAIADRISVDLGTELPQRG